MPPPAGNEPAVGYVLKATSISLLFIGLAAVGVYSTIPDEELIRLLFTAIVGAIIATFLSPHNQRWLFDMSKWMMQKFSFRRTGRRRNAQTTHQYRVPKGIESSVGSLSNLRAIRVPELWVVSSGKGGVGKSLLSLGLAERLTQKEPVLLVDFDLHNRGLTSLLDARVAGSSSTTFGLLGHFREMLRTAAEDSPYKSVLYNPYALPADFQEVHFNTMSLKYARDIRLDPNKWDDVGKYRRTTPKFPDLDRLTGARPSLRKNGLHAANLRFLPGRTADDDFLLSDQSTSSYVVVALFLHALCDWINETDTATKIILDCHGAHDHLTAGAIVAADKLLVVTTTDPGSYDGTAELLDFVSGISGSRLPTVIALNNCTSWDRRFDQANRVLKSYKGKLHIEGIVQLQHKSTVREITGDYRFGKVAEDRTLWPSVCRLHELLEAQDPADGVVANATSPQSDDAGGQGPASKNRTRSTKGATVTPSADRASR